MHLVVRVYTNGQTDGANFIPSTADEGGERIGGPVTDPSFGMIPTIYILWNYIFEINMVVTTFRQTSCTKSKAF